MAGARKPPLRSDSATERAYQRLLKAALAPLSRALSDYADGNRRATLIVHMEGHEPERLPASYFFRTPAKMDTVDRTALELARGRLLDVGAGVGAHALPLTQAGLSVTALEILPEAVRILRARGVKGARSGSLWTFHSRRQYDTVLALMNGTSLAGTMARLPLLLSRFKELVSSDGQVLLDSTEMDPAEIDFQLEYRGEKGSPFPQLFVGERVLKREARKAGFKMDVVAREEARYLARFVNASERT
jgi:hypothetical protein